MQVKSTTFALVLISSVSACASHPEPTESEFKVRTQESTAQGAGSINKSRAPVVLSDTAAIGFAKSATIPWRSQDYSMESLLEADRIVARPLFRKYGDDDAKQRLSEACPTFFGSKRFESIVEHNEAFSVSIDRGLAWVAKDSGALTLQRYPDKLEVSVVKDAEEAVQIAARELGKLGMWDLAEDVTLDIVSVSATMNASWDPHPDGTLTAVPVRHPLTGEDVTQYLSQHMVVFGRRFKGIPIERGALKVIIGAQGDLLGVLQEWREIIGEDDAGIAIDSSTTIEGRRDPQKAKLPLDTRVCAYFEASFVGWTQESPGVGCFYRSIVPGGIGLGRIQTDFVSMTSDPTVSLTGQRLGSNP